MLTIIASLLLVASTAFAAEPIGMVIDVVGNANVVQKGQKPIAAQLKQSIYEGDVIQTGSEGGVKILFKDDTVLTVKENSKALISKFLFDPNKGERNLRVDVAIGKIRTVVGRFFGIDQPVEIHTSTAVGGIRGTDIAAIVKPESTTFYCFDGFFGVYSKDYPSRVLEVSKGLFTEVYAGKLPTALRPIPTKILENNNTIFDIPVTANSQLSQATTSNTFLLAGFVPGILAESSSANSAVDYITNNSPTYTTDLGNQMLPRDLTQAGGGGSSGSSATIQIVIP